MNPNGFYLRLSKPQALRPDRAASRSDGPEFVAPCVITPEISVHHGAPLQERRSVTSPSYTVDEAYTVVQNGHVLCYRDLADRRKLGVDKWTIRSIFHLFDIALSNSWMQYVQDMRAQQKCQKEIVKFLELCLSVGEELIAQAQSQNEAESDSDEEWCPPPKMAPLPLVEARAKTLGNFPRLTDVPNAARCRLEGYNKNTKFFCTKCVICSFAPPKTGDASKILTPSE
ncbi:hypothetical protein HPB51_026636 [Rhipicephalus microplus]|uniref:PiggyBac transposable element-derived protein domain-containing protein n=1 Tax=Rhipicephalus microplus TaxID=6941 RepID=A0A9J6D2H4_RHIMP|nr:hypothetical protein HPB51_026636 [Rhipicephalus microplus]